MMMMMVQAACASEMVTRPARMLHGAATQKIIDVNAVMEI
jgi:hypothetical protein